MASIDSFIESAKQFIIPIYTSPHLIQVERKEAAIRRVARLPEDADTIIELCESNFYLLDTAYFNLCSGATATEIVIWLHDYHYG